MVEAAQLPDQIERMKRGMGRGSGLLVITLKKYSIKAIFSMCVKPAGHTEGVFSHHSGMGAVCLLCSLHFCSHPIWFNSFSFLLFFWDFLIVVLKNENF